MPRLPLASASVGILLAFVAMAEGSIASSSPVCQEVLETDPEWAAMRNFTQLLRCTGVPSVMLHRIWSPVSMSIDCGTFPTVSFYVGSSLEELLNRLSNKDAAWCTLSSLFRGRTCEMQLSPFGTTYIGIRKSINAGPRCTFSYSDDKSVWMLSSFFVGSLVFFLAGPLSESMALRITSGSLLFACGSIIIVMYVMFRMVPNRRSVTTAALFLGSSSLAVLRWLTGQWLPSLYTLLHSRWFVGYVIAWGMLGGASTYLYGGTDNPKVNTLVRIGLQLLGLVLLYMGSWTLLPASASLLGLLLLAKGYLAVVRRYRMLRSAPGGQGTHGQYQPQPARPDQYAYYANGYQANGDALHSEQHAQPATQQWQTAAHNPQHSTPGLRPPGLATPGSAVVGRSPQLFEGPPAVEISPLVRAHKIINPLSNKDIKIGGDLYNRLVEEGYVPDMVAGVLRPPPATPGSGSGSEGAYSQRRTRRAAKRGG